MTSKILDNLSDEEYRKFYDALAFTIAREGGYVDDPQDPGGETKWGIAKKFHPQEDIKNLSPERAAEIYYEQYWRASGAAELSPSLATVVFDTAVLMGVSRAKRFLKESGGDVLAYLAARRQHHLENSKPRFVKGHVNRVDLLTKYVQAKLQQDENNFA